MDPEKVTYFAQTDARNRRERFGIKAKDRTKHMYVIGKTGMGKSTLLENMAIQDVQNGEGITFIDPHGASAEKLLDYVPENRIQDVLYFAPFDLDYPIGFNIMEDVEPDKRHFIVAGLMSTFEKIWADAWSARMSYILQNTLHALIEYPDATLLDVNRMYTNKSFRDAVVANIQDVSVRSFWTEEFTKYTDRYTQEATPAIQNKIGQLAANPLIRNIVGQPKSTFDVRKMMDERKILIVNLSKGRVGEGNAMLLGSMMVNKIYLSAMSRADTPTRELEHLPQFYLYVDEFQNFANKSFADILSESRKYKLNLTIAHQYIEQMEEEVRAAVFGNVGTMITFRVGAYDAEVLEKEFAPKFFAQDLVNLGFTQIYLKLMIDGVSSEPFSATTLLPIPVPEISYTHQVIEASRKTYARSRADVEAFIEERHAVQKNNDGSQDKNGGGGRMNGSAARRAPRERTDERSDRPRRVNPQKQVFSEMEPSNHKEQLTEIAKTIGGGERERPKPMPKKDKSPANSENKDALRAALAGVMGAQKEAALPSKEEKTNMPRQQGVKHDTKQESAPSEPRQGTEAKEVPENVLKNILNVNKEDAG